MQTQKIKGITTELLVAHAAIERDIQVSIPFGDCARYDQIWDIDGKLFKVQIKHACVKDFGFTVQTKSVVRKAKTSVNHPYTKDDVDVIATFYKNRCYIIPIHLAPHNVIQIRETMPKNCQTTDIHWMPDFDLDLWLKNIRL